MQKTLIDTTTYQQFYPIELLTYFVDTQVVFKLTYKFVKMII